MKQKLPIIVAHRGLHDELPENSIEAMRAAWEAGIEWCECDVQLSADGVPVVIHDDRLERTTTGRGRVADLTWKELKPLRLRDGDGMPTKSGLPRLDELLAMSGRRRRLLVETKPVMGEAIEPIARKIARAGGMLHSFHVEDLLAATQCTKGKCEVALLAHDLEELGEFDGRHHVHHKSLGKQAKYDGFGVWTVNDRRAIRRMIELGVRMLITDKPLVAKGILNDGFRVIVKR